MHSRFSRFHIAAGKRSRNIQYYILFSSVESAQETMSRFSPADEYIQIIFIKHNLKLSQTLPIRQSMKRLRELEEKIGELEKRLACERAKENVILAEEEMRKFYRDALKAEPQILIQCLVKEVILSDDTLEIIYNSPLQNSPDESRDFSFYEGIVKIKYRKQNQKALQVKEISMNLKVWKVFEKEKS